MPRTTPVLPLSPLLQLANAPTIETTTTADAVTVTVTKDPNTDGELVYDGEYSYTRTDADYEVTVTAYTAEGATYQASEPTTLTFVVPAYVPPTPVETTTFVKVTSADQLVAGKKYIIVAGNKALGVEATGNFLTAIDITAGDEVEVSDNVAIMTLGGTAGHYTLALGDKYLHAANSTSLNFGTATEWAIADYNGTLDGYRVKHADYNRAVRRYSAGYDRFGNYSTSDDNSVYGWIYVEKSDEPVLQELTGEIVVSEPDDNGVVTVTYTGEENVTIMVNGEPVAESYQLEDGVPMTFEVVVSAEGYKDLTAEETRTWNKPAPTVWADPVVVVDDAVSEDGFLYATITWEEGGTLYIDGEEVVGYTSPYRYKIAAQSLQDQEGAFFCQVKGEGRENSNNVRTGWNLPAREATYAPAPVLNWNEETFTMTATLDRGHEIVLKKDGVVVENPCTVEQTYVEQTIMFSAYTTKEGEDYDSEVVYKQVTVPAKQKQDSATPVITVTEGDDAYTISADPCTTLLVDGEEVTNPYTVNRPAEGEEALVIFVTAINNEGEGYNDATATQRVVIPAKEPVTPDYTPVAPKVTIQTNDEDVVVEGIIEGAAADHGTVTLYTVDEEGVRHEVENPESFARENETYTVTVVAVATYENGEVMESEPVEVTVTKKEQQPDPTSINEMNGGKTVANVRYFNMAGQEMQEANGMTIVVTTYTDGTTLHPCLYSFSLTVLPLSALAQMEAIHCGNASPDLGLLFSSSVAFFKKTQKNTLFLL